MICVPLDGTVQIASILILYLLAVGIVMSLLKYDQIIPLVCLYSCIISNYFIQMAQLTHNYYTMHSTL